MNELLKHRMHFLTELRFFYHFVNIHSLVVTKLYYILICKLTGCVILS